MSAASGVAAATGGAATIGATATMGAAAAAGVGATEKPAGSSRQGVLTDQLSTAPVQVNQDVDTGSVKDSVIGAPAPAAPDYPGHLKVVDARNAGRSAPKAREGFAICYGCLEVSQFEGGRADDVDLRGEMLIEPPSRHGCRPAQAACAAPGIVRAIIPHHGFFPLDIVYSIYLVQILCDRICPWICGIQRPSTQFTHVFQAGRRAIKGVRGSGEYWYTCDRVAGFWVCLMLPGFASTVAATKVSSSRKSGWIAGSERRLVLVTPVRNSPVKSSRQ